MGLDHDSKSFCIDISAVSATPFSLQEKMWHSTLGGWISMPPTL